MNRDEMIKQLDQKWDLIIIGGGATGLGAAVDAASRGLKTLLLEQADFAKGTSSRSTKLIHGGLRYLEQGKIGLVFEALHERGLLFKNAPHLINARSFIVPQYKWWEGPYYGLGLKLYDLLAGRFNLEASKNLSRDKVLEYLPTLNSEGLLGGKSYTDGQFDDARFAITLARTFADLGGVPINYMPMTDLIKRRGKVIGVKAKDQVTGECYELHAKTVLNATGVFSDDVRKLDDPKISNMISPSQGAHLLFDRSLLPSDHALLIPHTEDKRLLFVVPWQGRTLIGTTDIPTNSHELEPKPTEEEVSFILKTASRYIPLKKEQILSKFAGLRPLVMTKQNAKTASLSREHQILISPSGLITIAGGKWTTYRKMGEDAIDAVVKTPSSQTKDLKLHGWAQDIDFNSPMANYGSDRIHLEQLIQEDPSLGERLTPKLPYLRAEVVWAIRYEMALTLDDILSRRTRSLFLDAKAAQEIAPIVNNLLQKELSLPPAFLDRQETLFKFLASSYLQNNNNS